MYSLSKVYLPNYSNIEIRYFGRYTYNADYIFNLDMFLSILYN